MKKSFIALSLASVMLFGTGGSFASASEGDSTYLDKILILQPDVTSQELLSSIKEISDNTGESEDQILEQIYNELNNDNLQGLQESKKSRGASGGTVIVGASAKGNFYYTPSETAYLNHGHVGMYYTGQTIVEAVPDKGVRSISSSVRKVDSSGAVVKSVTTTTQNKIDAAAWAYGEIGEDYSYNFATNRSTGKNGAKNCSKLIWSAYQLHGGLDLDDDGGAGVYPRDVRDAPKTKLVRNI